MPDKGKNKHFYMENSAEKHATKALRLEKKKNACIPLKYAHTIYP